jgi:hypothetical protein
MPEPGIFSLDDDLRSLMLRVNASLERVDLAVERFIRVADVAEKALESIHDSAERVERILAAVQGEK